MQYRAASDPFDGIGAIELSHAMFREMHQNVWRAVGDNAGPAMPAS